MSTHMATLEEPAAVWDGQPCANCTAPGAFELCYGCGATYYCDKACQKQHWKEGGHRLACADLEAVLLLLQRAHPHHPPRLWLQVEQRIKIQSTTVQSAWRTMTISGWRG
jgi:hypothetical protein